MTSQINDEPKKKGLFLKYQDFKKLERIIEEYNFCLLYTSPPASGLMGPFQEGAWGEAQEI